MSGLSIWRDLCLFGHPWPWKSNHYGLHMHQLLGCLLPYAAIKEGKQHHNMLKCQQEDEIRCYVGVVLPYTVESFSVFLCLLDKCYQQCPWA